MTLISESDSRVLFVVVCLGVSALDGAASTPVIINSRMAMLSDFWSCKRILPPCFSFYTRHGL